jgi:7-cyano-7-deazaguanine synthase
MNKRAVCLLSGGLDSAVALAIARYHGYDIFALSLSYKQRHIKELLCAKKLVRFLKAKEHKILDLDLTVFGGSALTSRIAVPTGKTIAQIKKSTEIPTTYVPARNTIFLSLALAYAEVVNADAIFLGVNAVDYSHYPDCRPEFIKKFQELAAIATKRGVDGKKIKIFAPLLKMSKAEIIKKGHELKVPFEFTWSCYQGKPKACGKCESCVLRLNGFKNAYLKDPIKYENELSGE